MRGQDENRIALRQLGKPVEALRRGRLCGLDDQRNFVAAVDDDEAATANLGDRPVHRHQRVSGGDRRHEVKDFLVGCGHRSREPRGGVVAKG